MNYSLEATFPIVLWNYRSMNLNRALKDMEIATFAFAADRNSPLESQDNSKHGNSFVLFSKGILSDDRGREWRKVAFSHNYHAGKDDDSRTQSPYIILYFTQPTVSRLYTSQLIPGDLYPRISRRMRSLPFIRQLKPLVSSSVCERASSSYNSVTTSSHPRASGNRAPETSWSR